MAKFPVSLDTQDDLFIASNRSISTLAVGVTASDMTFTLLSGTSFPLGRQIVSIRDELVIVESRTGDTFTIEERGAFGTTAAIHPINTPISGNFTAEHWNLMTQTVVDMQQSLWFFRSPVLSATEDVPATPAEDDSYIVPAGATAPWDTHEGEIATWDGTDWVYTMPEEGMMVYDLETSSFLSRGPTSWASGSLDAGNVDYDNSVSGATADNVQDALDEVFAKVATFEILISLTRSVRADDRVITYNVRRPFVLPADLVDSGYVIDATPSITLNIDIMKDATLIGQFVIASNVLTIDFPDDVTFNVGDVLYLIPDANAQFKSLSFTLYAERP